MSHQQDDWANWLPLVEFVYNNKVHTATRQTLFELDGSQHPHLGVEPMRMSTMEAADAFTNRLDHAQEEAKAALEQASDNMKRYYDWSSDVCSSDLGSHWQSSHITTRSMQQHVGPCSSSMQASTHTWG